jgi:hypothetical protein
LLAPALLHSASRADEVDEKHPTIYHPAALKAFRTVFKPVASK